MVRVIDQPIWEKQTLTLVNTSDIYDVGRCYGGSFQLEWGISNSGGTARLEASLDKVMWSTIPETECTVTPTADSILWNLGKINYPYIRLYFQVGDPTEVTARIYMKGG